MSRIHPSKVLAGLAILMAAGSLIFLHDPTPAVPPPNLDALTTDLRAAAIPLRSGESTYSIPLATRRGKTLETTVKINNSGAVTVSSPSP